MSLTDKNILIISPDSWGINFVSKHHYALQLSKTGNLVYFLNPPSNINSIEHVENNLYVVNRRKKFIGLRYLPHFLSGKIIKNMISEIEKEFNINIDIIWSFDSSRFFNLKFLKDKIRIAHIVDWTENFNRALLCRTADLCLCNSEYLRKDMVKFNSNTFNIGHGYSPSRYKLNVAEKNELIDTYNLKVGYIGNLNIRYIDWDLFYQLIIQHPSIGFYFVGPEGKSNLTNKLSDNYYLAKIKKLKNVHLLGEKPSYKIPAYLNQFDILVLIYMSQRFKKQLANPHKMLEYLASGKIIVSTWLEEYKDKLDLINMASNNQEFIVKFKEVTERMPDNNSAEKTKKRKAFALKNSYQDKIRLIEDLIAR